MEKAKKRIKYLVNILDKSREERNFPVKLERDSAWFRKGKERVSEEGLS